MRVSIYERRGSPAPLPAPQAPVFTPENDGGAALAGTVRNLADRAIKLINDHDDTRTLELFNKFKADSSEYHNNPDNGILNTRTGYLSQGLYQDADVWLRKKGEDYVRQLRSQRAKNNFRRMAGVFITQQGEANSRFEAAQMKKYRTETADAAINNYLADIEAHFDDPDFIKRAREAINQALELKHRGEGQEVFFNAGMEIDDKIAQARIRQAYLRDPLQAVRLLNDPDIKLKPDTRAKVTELLRNKTEVYELHAIAQEYSKQFTPEQATDAYNKLIQAYGAEKGQKAFAALSNVWHIAKYQETSANQRVAREQSEKADDFIRRFFSRDDTLTENEVLAAINAKSIDPRTGGTIINGIQARKAENERLEKARKKLLSEKAQMELEIASWSGIFADDNFLQGFARNGDLSDDFIRNYRNRRDAFYENQRKKTLNETADNLIRKLVDPDKFGRLTIDDIRQNLDNLDADKAKALKSAVEERDKAEAAKKAKNDEQARKHFETSLRIIAENGGIIKREQINQLQRRELISDSLATFLHRKEDEFIRNTEKENAEQIKIQRKNNLYSQAQELARLYPQGDSGNGLVYIHSLNIPPDDKNDLLKFYKDIIEAQRQRNEDLSDAAKRERDELLNMEYAKAVAGNGKSRADYLEMFTNGDINQAEYDKFISILDKHDTAAIKEKAFKRANELFDQFGLDNIRQANDAINAIPDINERNATYNEFNRRLTQARTERNENDRIQAEKQKENYRQLDNDYWRNLKPVPIEILERMRTNNELTEEQFNRAVVINDKIYERDTHIARLRQLNPDFDSWTLPQQEEAIMASMGTNQAQRRENVANLLDLLERGRLTDAEIDFAFHHGQISTEDRENIKNFDKRFEGEQRKIIHNVGLRLIQDINDFGIIDPNLRQKLKSNAKLDFMFLTNNLDPHAKDFTEQLNNIYTSVLRNAEHEYSEKVSLNGLLWGRTEAGKRVDAVLNNAANFSIPETVPSIPFSTASGEWSDITPQGINPYDTGSQIEQGNLNPDTGNLAGAELQHDPYYQSPNVVPPRAFTPSSTRPILPISGNGGKVQPMPTNIPATTETNNTLGNTTPTNKVNSQPRDIGLEMLPGATVTGRFNDWRDYRKGKHNGGDYATAEGTPIRAADYGIPVVVSKVNTANPHRGGGNSVILAGTDENGDYWEYIISHMKNGSIPLKVGDIVTPGTVIGQVGNTGMTSDRTKGGITAWYEGKSSGYHMDLKIRVNGKYIDPQKYVPPKRPQTQNTPTLPPPVVSSENDIQAVIDIIFGGYNSDDILSPHHNYNYGVN